MPGSEPISPVADAAPYIAGLHRQGIRDLVHQIIKIWLEVHPREVLQFVREARRVQRWYRETGPAMIVRRTNWAPKLQIPARLYWAIAKQFAGPDGPCDWLQDPVILDIVLDEISLIRVAKTTRRIIS
jgi:hypothetical protein